MEVAVVVGGWRGERSPSGAGEARADGRERVNNGGKYNLADYVQLSRRVPEPVSGELLCCEDKNRCQGEPSAAPRA